MDGPTISVDASGNSIERLGLSRLLARLSAIVRDKSLRHPDPTARSPGFPSPEIPRSSERCSLATIPVPSRDLEP
jgi:hypothetical protein